MKKLNRTQIGKLNQSVHINSKAEDKSAIYILINNLI
jgi:hypothetical protein